MTVTVSRDIFDESKKYDKVITGSGVPVVDADLNAAQEIQRIKLKRIVKDAIGDGYPTGSTGFKIEESATDTTNNFVIKSGDFYLDGWRVYLDADVEYKNQKISANAVVTAISTVTVTSLHKSWVVSDLVNSRIRFTTGALAGNTYTITASTANTITTATDLQAAGLTVRYVRGKYDLANTVIDITDKLYRRAP